MTEKPPLYVANPDVSCRPEGEDGALLFNPDTDQILVINPTGLLIWQALGEPRSQSQLVEAFGAQCDGLPDAEELERDVAEFVEQLLAKGFVGLYGGVVT
jgi:hypothetical protein